MKNLFDMFGLSYRAPVKGDSRRASYTAVPVDRAGGRGGGPRRRSYGNNRRQSLDPAAVLGRHLFDGRLADPRTRNAWHSFIEGNEKADLEAKKAADSLKTPILDITTYPDIKYQIKELIKIKWKSHWRKQNNKLREIKNNIIE